MLSFLKTKVNSTEAEGSTVTDIAEEASELLIWKETVYDIIRTIQDPEKPETLEELDVVQEDLVQVRENLEKPGYYTAKITFVPTVPHCSLATLIGK